MTSKSELQVALRLTLILLVVGVFCYAAFPVTPPERPVRLAFQTKAGKVMFDHKTHLSTTGYGLNCVECHHHPGDSEADTETLGSCGACHAKTGDTQKVAQTCNECHDPEDYDLSEVVAQTDAFHTQCITCHKEFGAGPVECGACHVS
jgi:hypothetical protein